MSNRNINHSSSSNAPLSVTFKSPRPIVFTPQSSPPTRPGSVTREREAISIQGGLSNLQPVGQEAQLDEEESGQEDMDSRRPPFHRPTDGQSAQPLLGKEDEERGREGYDQFSEPLRRPSTLSRRSMRSRSPDALARLATRKKYTYAAFFLVLSLISFTVQTETANYITQVLGWKKSYCMLWVTHSSWTLLWPSQLLVLRLQKWNMPWKVFWRRHVFLLRTTAQMIETQELVVPRLQRSPAPYFLKMIPFVTTALTIAGGSWYVAVNMTSGSDLTAIYNCSAFFAYVFSVPLLNEKLRWGKSFAVIVAIIGVLVVAYGDAQPATHDSPNRSPAGVQSAGGEADVKNRLWGNIIIGVSSVLYGLYEVLYKKLACPPEGTSPGRGMIFANAVGTLIGSFTFFILWIPIPILHYMGWETFELPRGEAAWMLLISVLGNVTFSGSFLILISLTSPVLSSVAALLTIFIVAIVEWLLMGKLLTPGAIAGGVLIIGAFGMLTWSTYKEMQADRGKKEVDLVDSDDESDEEDP